MGQLEHHVTDQRRRNSQAVGELVHDGGLTGEGQDRDEGKGQLRRNQKVLIVLFGSQSCDR